MNKKDKCGFVAVDMTIAVIAVLIFSTLIISLIYNNKWQNIKIKRKTLAIMYLTETFENIGIADYIDINNDNRENLKPTTAAEDGYTIDLEISDTDENQEKIIKKIIATISYKVGNKDYKLSMQRMKVKG